MSEITAGNLYVVPGNHADIAIEICVIDSEHSIDGGLVMVVPADDNTVLIGSCDIDVSTEAGRPFVLRCGLCCLVETRTVGTWTLVGNLPDAHTKVSPILSRLARGLPAGDHDQKSVDANPEYHSHIAEVMTVNLASPR